MLTAAFERRSAPACATLATAVPSAQVRLGSFCSHVCGEFPLNDLFREHIYFDATAILLHLLYFNKYEFSYVTISKLSGLTIDIKAG